VWLRCNLYAAARAAALQLSEWCGLRLGLGLGLGFRSHNSHAVVLVERPVQTNQGQVHARGALTVTDQIRQQPHARQNIVDAGFVALCQPLLRGHQPLFRGGHLSVLT
jgi:hypothetical protein